MALRNIERKPWASFFTAFGLALATGIPVVPGAMRDGIGYILDFQWELAQRQTVTIGLIEPGSASARPTCSTCPACSLRNRFAASPRASVLDIAPADSASPACPPTSCLTGCSMPAPARFRFLPMGLLVSAKLAEIIGAKPGDQLELEIQEGQRPTRRAIIHGLITDYAGIAIYMEIGSLRRLMREGGTVSGSHLSVDARYWHRFLQAAKEAPRIASLIIKDAVRQSFRKSTAEMIGMIQTIYFAFAVIVSFGVVYNSARIALSERSRDLATLRVIGFTHREVAAVLIGELALLTLIALPIGLVIGSLLAAMIIDTASTETVRLPLVLSARTYATAALIVLTSSLLSFAVVSSRIRRLDLLGVLKARE